MLEDFAARKHLTNEGRHDSPFRGRDGGKLAQKWGIVNRGREEGRPAETTKPDGVGLRCTLNWCGADGTRTHDLLRDRQAF